MTLSRRHAIKMASSLALGSPLFAGAQNLAQAVRGTDFEMAAFLGPGIDADTAFAKALTAVALAGGAGVTLNLEKDTVYRVTRPLSFMHLDGFTLNGNGASVINTGRSSTMHLSACRNNTVRDLSIDYDPLPFTQGTIVDFDHAAIQVTLEVDPGYPDDPALLAMFTGGSFKVIDRRTRALKPGARDFLSPKSATRVAPGVIRVQLQWSANDTFPSQLPIVRGDAVAITGGSAHAVVITESTSTSFVDVRLFASPGMGVLENDGPGGTTFSRVSIIPGPIPKGATAERLVSTNSDGSHFSTLERGPTIEDCVYANTSDDAVNVHGFYLYVVQKTGPGRFVLSPKWDQGLAAGDTIETCQQGTFRSLGRTRIETFAKRKAPELKAQIAKLWAARSPTTLPDLVYDVVLAQDLPLRVADAVTSLTRIGAGAAVRRSSFHACGRVLVKSPNAVVENQLGFIPRRTGRGGPEIVSYDRLVI